MLVRVMTAIPEEVTSKQQFIIIIFTEEIQIQDEKLWNSTRRFNLYIRLCVNECNMIFLIPTYFPTDLPTIIPFVYPIYDFSKNLSAKTAWFHLIIFVQTFRTYYWELFEMVGKNW